MPVLCDLKPSGKYVTTNLHAAGGIPQVMKILLAHGVMHGDALTITGKTVAEVLADVPAEPRKDQDVIHSWDKPVHAAGPPRDPAGQPGRRRRGRQNFRRKNKKITGRRAFLIPKRLASPPSWPTAFSAGDVHVIRYEGPKGGPGMREMLAPTSALIGAGLGDSVA